MEKKMISIIVPVYNVEKYLPACLDSICHQTLKELEIILVDDDSTDNSGRIAEQYALQDKRIRVVHQRNGNPGATRNVGLELATGEYIGFVDSDDWIEPEMFASLYAKAEADNLDIVVTGVTTEWLRDNRKKENRIVESITEWPAVTSLDAFLFLKEKRMFAVAYNKLYRSELLKKQKVRFMEMLPHEDLVFNLRAFSLAERIGFIPDSSPYHYLCRDGMSAAGSFSPDHLLACQLTEDAFRHFFRIHDWNNNDMESYLRSRRIINYSAYAAGLYKKNCPFTRRERIGCLEKELKQNSLLKRDLILSRPAGFQQRMFYFFLFKTTSGITDSYYRILFYMRYHFDGVYRMFRRLISK